MRNWRKTGAAAAVAASVICGALTSVQAGELETFRRLTDGSGLRSQQEAELTAAIAPRSVNLRQGTVHIGVIDRDTVYILGRTEAYNVCDRIDLEMYLEQSYGNTFASYKSYEYTAQNVEVLSKAFYVDVEPGYYYCLRGYHLTYHNGLKESGSTDTDGVPVGL